MRRRPPPGHFDLLDDLRRSGCPVCRAGAVMARRVIDDLLWEGVNDPGVRARWRASYGFCADHALLLLQLAGADGQAIALLYGDLLGHVRREAGRAARAGLRWPWRRAALAPLAGCQVCEAVDQRADTYLELLAGAEPHEEVGEAARAPGRALCVPHLRRGFEVVASSRGRRRLVDIFTRADDALQAELEEYLRRQASRDEDKPAGPEQGAWRRALLRAVGLPHHRIAPPAGGDARVDPGEGPP